MTNANEAWIDVKVFEITQPIGRFYFGAMKHKELARIAYSDIRRIDGEQRAVETYLGIERPLRSDRVAELKDYVNTVDATFPSPVILAISEEDAKLDLDTGIMSIKDDRSVAKILDGQHRIGGLEGYDGDEFDVLVTIFVDMDIEFQAMVFATINLEQTKVNRSLAYDLFEYATTRSPQKTCHNISRLLNSREESPFYKKIKVLGVAGGRTETISQALFVDSLLPLISRNANKDRDDLRRHLPLEPATRGDADRLIFRNLFIEEKDGVIARVLWNYFQAVESKWDRYWTEVIPGQVLNRTTGFRGLMEFLPYAYVEARGAGGNPTDIQFDGIFERIRIDGSEINSENYRPGTAGSTRFREHLKARAGVG